MSTHRQARRSGTRVFCVRHTDDGTKVLSASEAKSIRTPEKPEPTPTPTPEPEHLSIDAGVEGGHIVIHWEACGGESFSHYRVLRKTSGDATLLTEIENAGTTTYVDASVEPGVEYHYLVQCKGHSGDGYILLGATDWVAATVEEPRVSTSSSAMDGSAPWSRRGRYCWSVAPRPVHRDDRRPDGT